MATLGTAFSLEQAQGLVRCGAKRLWVAHDGAPWAQEPSDRGGTPSQEEAILRAERRALRLFLHNPELRDRPPLELLVELRAIEQEIPQGIEQGIEELEGMLR
jgi:hypothetical protein